MFVCFRPNNIEMSAPNHKNMQPAAMPAVMQRDDKPHLSAAPVEDVRRETQWHDDSLSSLSIESEDDTNLLSQVI